LEFVAESTLIQVDYSHELLSPASGAHWVRASFLGLAPQATCWSPASRAG